MSTIKCQKCGAVCAAGTSFCRQCGHEIDPSAGLEPSEAATAVLDPSNIAATQRFEARTTGPERLPQPVMEKNAGGRRAILIGAFVVGVLAVICVAAVVGLRGRSETTENLMYPGARTIVDMTNERGGRALHLETSDSFEKVEAWYQKQLKPDKTMRLTSTSVVLKNARTTATIASEGTKTSILIKVVD